MTGQDKRIAGYPDCPPVVENPASHELHRCRSRWEEFRIWRRCGRQCRCWLETGLLGDYSR